MRFGVLGPLAVWDKDGHPLEIREPKVRALLANLLVHGGAPVPADRLIADLWHDMPPREPRNALQTKISQLRRVLGRDRLVHEAAGYRLVLAEDDIDASRFERLASRIRSVAEAGARAALGAEALGLWRGAAYSDVADSLVTSAEIARLTELRLTVVEDHVQARLDLGEHAALAAELTALVAEYPARERLRMVQLRALYLAGRQGDALAAFQELRRYLAAELGLDPGPEVTALHESILRQDAELGSQAASQCVPTWPRRRTDNLPSPATSLIGRKTAVGAVSELLGDDPNTRLVTLTGPGGVGKTRLAVAVAERLLGRFADGVWLVELAGVSGSSTVDDIAERVIATLGLCDTTSAESDPIDLLAWLCQSMVDKSLLLVLDNCEHVIGPVARLADAALAAAAGVRLIVTSQEVLDTAGETVHLVPPLELPPAAEPAEGDDPETACAASSAVELFVARATAAAPGFHMDGQNAKAIREICRRLDGIPLALELVASRLRVLAPTQLAASLDNRFSLPGGRARGRAGRQQTLRAMIDWSWDLLTEPERIVLRRLAVHADGCTQAAAEAVCADVDIAADDVLPLLARLVDKSLVVAERGRFRLLESVAAYCTERMREVGELDCVHARFVDCYVELAELADDQLRGAGQIEYLTRLDTETVNLRRALDAALLDGAVGKALRLVNALSWYWLLRGRIAEARRSFDSVLSLGGGASADRVVAGAWLRGFELRMPALAVDRTAAEVAVTEVADVSLHGRLCWFIGSALSANGQLAAGERLFSAGLALAAQAGDRWGEAVLLVERASHPELVPDPVARLADARQGAAYFAESADRWGRLRGLRSLALAAESVGDRTEAVRLHEAALEIAEELALWSEAVETLCWLGDAALAQGELAGATAYYDRARRLATERSYVRGEVRARTGLDRANGGVVAGGGREPRA
ncbi:putative ATPase [Tamaricihabitans halophyticus]|uniref:Putative ATPase n=1 Tax=Tamaricihabitans halophyticus TaxID=1262583 RepID=A0A4V2SU82_9PSEU|nr:BTAD domain-containing putative transcriptional regulator [Tamaricihabitans halophyticus]TCP53536.1 putative ATPase [Tamaricihabitans halophyticus]